MVFNSAAYLFCFFPLMFLASRAAPAGKWRKAVLCAGGLLFYAFGEPVYVLLLLFTALLHYALGRALGRAGRKKLLCALGVVYDLALLLGFKYLPFFCGTVNALFGLTLSVPALTQPAGLSFFSFQAIAYLCDVYRGEDPGAEDFLSLLLYLSFFPRLLSGPLVRHRDHASQLAALRFSPEASAAGLRRFTVGLAKKLLLADSLGRTAEALLSAGTLSCAGAWLGAAAYTLQLYFDFSGYSDMAVGMGRCFGFDFPENFDRPYIAASLTEFWRRWHMTLSRWFRDYVYIPLGGNRRGKGRTAVNKLIVFLLTGLWHGAGWTFLLWGLWHGAWMMLESGCRGLGERLRRTLPGRVLLRVYTLLVVITGFVLFRAASLGEAAGVLAAMFRFSPADTAGRLIIAETLDGAHLLTLCAGAGLSLCPRPAPPKSAGAEKLRNAGALALLLLSLTALAAGGFTPFIYFRF